MSNLKHFDFIPGTHWQTRKQKRDSIYAVLATILLSAMLCLGVILGRFI
jgi:hypothetical protein